MRFTTALAAVAGAAAVYGQSLNLTNLEQTALSYLTPQCSGTLLKLATSGPLAQCLQLQTLAPILNSTTTPLIPIFDHYLSAVCNTQPCSNAVLSAAAANITTACAQDFSNFGIANSTITEAFGLYPLGHEVVCLKTKTPFRSSNATIYSNTTYGSASSSSNSTTSASNSTSSSSSNGTYCATSLATELQAYLGANLTTGYVVSAALGSNQTVLQRLQSIPPTAICNDCIYAAIDLVELEYPAIRNVNIGNYTINSALNQTCKATNLTLSTNGTLPSTIELGTTNSSFPFNITYGGNMTYKAPAGAVAPPPINITFSTLGTQVGTTVSAATATGGSSLVGVPATTTTGAIPGKRTAAPAEMKKRWFGQW